LEEEEEGKLGLREEEERGVRVGFRVKKEAITIFLLAATQS
jgi:hypothetical protein